MIPRILALDFDGVIVDSVHECAVTGYNAYSKYKDPESPRIISKQTIPDAIYNDFLSLRHFIRNSEDYVFIYDMLFAGFVPDDQNAFDHYIKDNESRKSIYHDLFYNERNSLLNDNVDAWMELNPFYVGLELIVSKLSKSKMFYIVSTKKPEFILRILQYNGIEMDPGRVKYGGGDQSKKDIMAGLIKDSNISPRELVFIDDHLGILKNVSETGADCRLATWGYNTKVEIVEASSINIGLAKVNDIHVLCSMIVQSEGM